MIDTKCDELNDLAESAAQELLKMEEQSNAPSLSSSSSSKKSKPRTAKQQKSTPKGTGGDDVPPPASSEASETPKSTNDTIEKSSPTPPSQSNKVQSKFDEIKAHASELGSSDQTAGINASLSNRSDESTGDNESSLRDDARDVVNRGNATANGSGAQLTTVVVNTKSNEPIAIKTKQTSISQQTGDDDNGQQQQQQQQQQHQRRRIQELESIIQQKDAEMEAMKRKNEETLRSEREMYEERMQAIQLRLYISETRLKTFQDALDQHVQAVASNVSQNYTTSIIPDESDGDAEYGDGTSSSPMFARVRRNRSRNGKHG
eukprot:CAMPEP_0119572840 /NCGR_PEP_ID=MMETSP1352-20130426/44824_1 /TAXON_ID=265584 /ORGANISM="Stauroneis constricta, Strain CCMP1120" /LENGTH=317 /DNA_ID=CAMNT_0007622527 /DNA_START=263 /DNA_END=1216 /DNA_ORIENTATION=+